MRGGKILAADIKRTSVLRRLPTLGRLHYREAPGDEGSVCAFQLVSDASPIIVEAVSGRAMALVPRDVFLATPGHRESTRWVVGGIPKRGLSPRKNYWILSESGVVGNLVAGTPLTKSHLGRVKYLGVVCRDDDQILNIRQFAVNAVRASDKGAAVYLFVGTSAEVGKSTAVITVLQALLKNGHSVVAFKATGTSSFGEIVKYKDYGAAQVFDCVDFGLPTTYPSERVGIGRIFDHALDACLSIPTDAILIECGGDMLGANVPIFLKRLKQRRSHPKVILAAADALGALSGASLLRKLGLPVSMITGPCTDTPTLSERTRKLCGIPAINMLQN
jgi:hypothetical protein